MRALTPLLLLTLSAYVHAETLPSFLNSNDTIRNLPVPNLPADAYRPDCSPPSYDKQFVRDHLLALKWNQQPPAPRLPADVITRTQEKYLAALQNLLG